MAQYVKGQSGNPSGRPKMDPEVVELARANSVRAIGRLAELMEADNGRVAVAACTAILDRAYGKPTQPIAGDDAGDPIRLEVEAPSVEALARMTPEDRAAIRDILVRVARGDRAQP